MFPGISGVSGELSDKITKRGFQKGLIIETSGADDQVIKLFCPLVISMENLAAGIDILESAIREVCAKEDSFPEQKKYFDQVSLVS